jgi:hypothetical protein
MVSPFRTGTVGVEHQQPALIALGLSAFRVLGEATRRLLGRLIRIPFQRAQRTRNAHAASPQNRSEVVENEKVSAAFRAGRETIFSEAERNRKSQPFGFCQLWRQRRLARLDDAAEAISC